MANLIRTVFVADPDRPGAKRVLFQLGDQVPERFWPLMTNPALWQDGILPGTTDQDGQDDGGDGDAKESAPNKKPAARKPAAPKPASSRKAADEGTGGQ